jgi:hypothetical protein
VDVRRHRPNLSADAVAPASGSENGPKKDDKQSDLHACLLAYGPFDRACVSIWQHRGDSLLSIMRYGLQEKMPGLFHSP